HFENLFFQLLALSFFLKSHSSAARPRWTFLWALAAGFALFVSMDCVFLVAGLSLVHLAVRCVRQTLRDLRLIVPGALIGLAPLIWVQFASRGTVSGFLDTSFTAGRESFFARILQLWTELLPRAGVFEDLGPLPKQIAASLYLGAFLLAWASLAIVVVRTARASALAQDETR